MSKETNKLAVVLPAFNEEHAIEATLKALYDQTSAEALDHIVVDNGSTDNTRAKVLLFAKNHDGFPLRIVEESEKGTGAAADTGIRSAIEQGATLIARTDADTHPNLNWTQVINNRFNQDTRLHLLGGRTNALRDHDYRRGDNILMPMSVKAARYVLAAQHLNPRYLKAVTGGNMATDAYAYENVGGFPRTSINESDEDIAYSLRIGETYGQNAIMIDPELLVATSMRRIRELGWAGTALHHLKPGHRADNDKTIDIR